MEKAAWGPVHLPSELASEPKGEPCFVMALYGRHRQYWGQAFLSCLYWENDVASA